jgi:drug/metabolite transporter (DMT)-like permease
MVAVTCFSVNDVAVKFLSGDYALHQVVLFRALIGMALLLGLMVPLSGGLAVLRTTRPGLHLVRGLCVVFANMTFFLGLAALPLAEGVAIFFISPVLITVFSVLFLKEHVGPRRWASVVIGLIGVLIVLRPGTAAFHPAALLPVAAATGYALLHIFTRRIGTADTAQAMTFYIQLTFIIVSSGMGLAFGQGQLGDQSDPSLAFLFRAWVWIAPEDWWILILVGATSTAGGYFISQAYRVAEAALVAPFEYLAMPLAVLSGILVFGEWPDAIALAGIALILGSGLYMLWRDTRSEPTPPRKFQTTRYRR